MNATIACACSVHRLAMARRCCSTIACVVGKPGPAACGWTSAGTRRALPSSASGWPMALAWSQKPPQTVMRYSPCWKAASCAGGLPSTTFRPMPAPNSTPGSTACCVPRRRCSCGSVAGNGQPGSWRVCCWKVNCWSLVPDSWRSMARSLKPWPSALTRWPAPPALPTCGYRPRAGAQACACCWAQRAAMSGQGEPGCASTWAASCWRSWPKTSASCC
ncbi:hypothetical protein D3C77_441820 [compost metagenome]